MAWQYWTEAPHRGRWREVPTRHAQGSDLRIRTTASAISKGTEILVHTGRVPDRVAELMRAPRQLGDFPAPVSYGYLSVGVVDEGPADWLGTRVFGLLPHHSHHLTTPAEVVPIPPDIDDHRALLAGAAETGLTILWLATPRFGDRVTIIGAGMIGTATALLASRLPLERLEVVESDPRRREHLGALGLSAVAPEAASGDADITIHTSGTEAGLTRALEVTGDDGTVVEASWFGTTRPRVPLGAEFHARRLRLLSSQVGEVPVAHRARRTRRQRLTTALEAVRDDRFDALITGVSNWSALPEVMDSLSTDTTTAAATLCHVLDYRDAATDDVQPARAQPAHLQPAGAQPAHPEPAPDRPR